MMSTGSLTPTHNAHEIARRSTADGKHVCLWSDGDLTWALGYRIKGWSAPLTTAQRERAFATAWLILGDVELYDAHEITSLIQAARWAVARDGLPGTMRKRFTQLS